jgi:hypothetical protein
MPGNPAQPVANNKVMHGARAVVSVNGKVCGVFTSVSYGVAYNTIPVYILGRPSAAEIAMVGMETVKVSCHGWRVVDHGPFAIDGGNMSQLQNLLTDGDVTLAVSDKVTGANIMTVKNCRVVRFSTQMSTRNLQDVQVDFEGLTYSDEAGDQQDVGNVLP